MSPTVYTFRKWDPVCEVIKPVLESIVAKPKLENYLKTDI